MNFKLHPSLYLCPENRSIISLDSLYRVSQLISDTHSKGSYYYCYIHFMGVGCQEFHFVINDKEASERAYNEFLKAWSDWKEKAEKL